MRNLLKNPIWRSLELGYSIPDNAHAVSVALPTWEDVINYEEKNPECIESLKSIYPRFGFNPLVKRLCESIEDNVVNKIFELTNIIFCLASFAYLLFGNLF